MTTCLSTETDEPPNTTRNFKMVTDRHKAFARAVVALAREHRMNNLDMTFRESLRSLPSPEPRCWEQVRMTWSEGRHGDKGRIELTTQAKEEIPESA